MAVGMSTLGWLALGGMKRSIRSTVDEQLADRMKGARALILRAAQSRDRLSANDLREHLELGKEEILLQVADEDGNWIYQSEWVRNHALPTAMSAKQGGTFVDVKVDDIPLRVMTAEISPGSHRYRVQIAEAMDDYYEAISRFGDILLALIPVLLVTASVAGYWMSRRALAPVDQITKAAQNINAHNLSARIPNPNSQDELQRLVETLNEMLERIDSAMKKITQFTADASHELRTPVALMRTRAELALRRPRTAAENRETIEQLHAELVRTSELIEKLMLLARGADAKSDLLQLTPVDLGQIVHETLLQTEALVEHKQLVLDARLPEASVWVNGDSQFLHQLCVILIDNAVKYTPAPGKITLALAVTDASATLSVSDTGIGITAAELENIFDRFYRADKARSRGSGGAGLGLAIGRWIAESHGGSIMAHSTPGAGSKFCVVLPLLPVECAG